MKATFKDREKENKKRKRRKWNSKTKSKENKWLKKRNNLSETQTPYLIITKHGIILRRMKSIKKFQG